jgi:endoglucanase
LAVIALNAGCAILRSNQAAPKMTRGVNLGNALEAPTEGEWGVILEERYFREIARAGFDTVRVPVRWSAHAGAEPPYTIEPAFMERIDWVVDQALRRGLTVVLNVHHYEELATEPDSHRERFLSLWRQIANTTELSSTTLFRVAQ